jgi:hypothetical protein
MFTFLFHILVVLVFLLDQPLQEIRLVETLHKGHRAKPRHGGWLAEPLPEGTPTGHR